MDEDSPIETIRPAELIIKKELQLVRRKKLPGDVVKSNERKNTEQGISIPLKFKFWLNVVLVQAVGLACVGTVIYWSKLHGGFSWSKNPTLQFNFHPVFMILGLVYCYGNVIIAFNVLSLLPKTVIKIMMILLHLCALVSSFVGLIAVFEFHRRTNKPNFYSLHSWIGITTFGFISLYYIRGFIGFLYTGIQGFWKAGVKPNHTFFGIVLFALAIVSAVTGLTSFHTEITNDEQVLIGNLLGCGLIVFGVLIVFLITYPPFKRKFA